MEFVGRNDKIEQYLDYSGLRLPTILSGLAIMIKALAFILIGNGLSDKMDVRIID